MVIMRLNAVFGTSFSNLSSIVSSDCLLSLQPHLARHSQLSRHQRSLPVPFTRSTSTLPARPTQRSGLANKPIPKLLPPIPSASALDMLRSEANHYVVTFLVGKRYKLMVDDQVTVPHIKDLKVGDLVKLTRVTEVGSRNFTLRAVGNGTVGHAKRETLGPASQRWLKRTASNSATPEEKLARVTCLKPEIPHYLDEGLVEATAIVVEHTRGQMLTVIKKKRRKGYRKTIKNKPYYTRLRLCDIKLPTI